MEVKSAAVQQNFALEPFERPAFLVAKEIQAAAGRSAARRSSV
jgi:hypothetical protein